MVRTALGAAFVFCMSALAGCPSAPRRRPNPPVVELPPVEPPTATVEARLEPEEPAFIVPEDERAPDGPSCASSGECAMGMACRGPRGCNVPWACGPAPDCSGERIAYCDCDGHTFYAPMGCPGRPYAHPGACEAMGPLAAADEFGVHAHDEPPTSQDRVCTSDADCPAGERCWGPPGCNVTWRCERVRGCGRERVELCDCRGEVFRASPRCPGRPYAGRAPCGTLLADARATSLRASSDAPAAAPQQAPLEAPQQAPLEASQQAPAAAPQQERFEVALGREVAVASAPPDASRVCTSNRDCRRGFVCTGPQGCGETWYCERPRERCNPDTQVFCDCERNTFRASMNCPGRPFAHRGSCEIDRLLELSGAVVR